MKINTKQKHGLKGIDYFLKLTEVKKDTKNKHKEIEKEISNLIGGIK